MGVITPEQQTAIHERWMELAFVQAEQARRLGEVPVGAIVVHEGRVVGTGFNQPIMNSDPSAHAEVIALRSAGQTLQNYRLPGCRVYVTLEPCAMCAMAMLHARVSEVIYAANDPKTGAAGSVVDLFGMAGLNHQTRLTGGILAPQAADLLQRFFQERRRARRDMNHD